MQRGGLWSAGRERHSLHMKRRQGKGSFSARSDQAVRDSGGARDVDVGSCVVRAVSHGGARIGRQRTSSFSRVEFQCLGASSTTRVTGQCGASRKMSSRYVSGLSWCRRQDAINERKVVYQRKPVSLAKKVHLCRPRARFRSCCSDRLLCRLMRASSTKRWSASR